MQHQQKYNRLPLVSTFRKICCILQCARITVSKQTNEVRDLEASVVYIQQNVLAKNQLLTHLKSFKQENIPLYFTHFPFLFLKFLIIHLVKKIFYCLYIVPGNCTSERLLAYFLYMQSKIWIFTPLPLFYVNFLNVFSHENFSISSIDFNEAYLSIYISSPPVTLFTRLVGSQQLNL